jgi:hypothetical protein
MDFKRGILGAIMGGASGLQEGKKKEIEAEKAGTLEMMKALREENLARFKHDLDLDTERVKQGYTLEQKEKENEYAVAREEAKPKSAPTTREVNRDLEEVTQEWDGEKWVEVSTAPRWNPKEGSASGSSGGGSGEGKPGDLNTLDATRVIDIGKEIEKNYTGKGNQVPEWMLNDWNVAREAVGLPTVSQEKVKEGYVRDKWKLELKEIEGEGSSGILSGVIKQVQEDQAAQKGAPGEKPEQKPEEKPAQKPEEKKLSINDVIASVKSGQKGMPQAGAATEQKPEEKPEQKPEQKANAWAGYADRQAEIQRTRQIDQLIDESAKAKEPEKKPGVPWERSESRSRSVRERRERLERIRQLMDEGKK